jgi:hypothetical protein
MICDACVHDQLFGGIGCSLLADSWQVKHRHIVWKAAGSDHCPGGSSLESSTLEETPNILVYYQLKNYTKSLLFLTEVIDRSQLHFRLMYTWRNYKNYER